jgi:hypothetical protein
MVLRELSFSGHELTAAQIAKAIDYTSERTKTALERLERDGQVLRNEGRWTIGTTSLAQTNGHAIRSNRSSPKQDT